MRIYSIKTPNNKQLKTKIVLRRLFLLTWPSDRYSKVMCVIIFIHIVLWPIKKTLLVKFPEMTFGNHFRTEISRRPLLRARDRWSIKSLTVIPTDLAIYKCQIDGNIWSNMKDYFSFLQLISVVLTSYIPLPNLFIPLNTDKIFFLAFTCSINLRCFLFSKTSIIS